MTDVPLPATLIVACGALAHEIIALVRVNGWEHVQVRCLPAALHNTPTKIPDAVRSKIRDLREGYERVFVAYADCGSGGLLDRVLEEEGVERLPGAHCYEMFAGAGLFAELAEREPGTFYLTDYLARNFDRLIIDGLGIDRHPELQSMYFGNYRKLLYLAQTNAVELDEAARRAATRLGLEFERRYTGLAGMDRALRPVGAPAQLVVCQS